MHNIMELVFAGYWIIHSLDSVFALKGLDVFPSDEDACHHDFYRQRAELLKCSDYDRRWTWYGNLCAGT